MCANGLLYTLITDINHRKHYFKFGNGLIFKDRSLTALFKIMMN